MIIDIDERRYVSRYDILGKGQEQYKTMKYMLERNFF